MKKLFNTLRCLVGMHSWRYRNKFHRHCANCQLRQMRVPYNMNNWFKF